MRKSFIVIVGMVVLLSVAGLLGFSGVKEYKRVSAIDREIAQLRAEVERLERKNADLQDRISYFSSDAYHERLAKDRLGYRRKDEQVVMIAPSQNSTQEERMSDTQEDTSVPVRVQTWFERLFGRSSYAY